MNYGMASYYGDNGEIYALKKILKNNPSLEWAHFDVGANQGTYTRAVLPLLADRPFQLHAFEPSGDSFRKLSEAITITNQIYLWNLGLSDSTGNRELHSDTQGSTLSSIYKRDLNHINKHFNRVETISVETLDDFCDRNKIPKIDFLKLDVEGHELSVLTGASKMLKNNNIRYIQFEFGGGNIDSRTYFKDFFLLLSPQYKIYRILKNGLFEITSYSERLEVFQSANYLASLRDSK